MKLRITVHGNAYEVEVEVLDAGEGFPAGPLPKIAQPVAPASATAPPPGAPPIRQAPRPSHAQNTGGDGSVTSPIAGTVLEIKCASGNVIQQGQELLVIEAMKMETSIAAPSPGTVKSVDVAVGDSVREGQVLIQFE